jgi:hypothetical protein
MTAEGQGKYRRLNLFIHDQWSRSENSLRLSTLRYAAVRQIQPNCEGSQQWLEISWWILLTRVQINFYSAIQKGEKMDRNF